MLSPLARGCFEDAPPEAAVRAAEHLWENRRLARALLADAYAVVERRLAALVASTLTQARGHETLRLEPHVAGALLAAGRLAVLRAWLSGRSSRTAEEIAHALHDSGRAVIAAMLDQRGVASRS